MASDAIGSGVKALDETAWELVDAIRGADNGNEAHTIAVALLSTHTAAGAEPVGDAVAWDFQPDLANDPELGKEPSLREIVRDHYAREIGETEGKTVTDLYIREHLAARPVDEPGEVERLRAEVHNAHLAVKEERALAAAAEADLAETRERLEKQREIVERWASGYCFNEDSDEDVALRAALTGDAQEAGR